MHLSRESARAAEVEQSSFNPRRFARTSWRTSKFVLGGGACRLFSGAEVNIEYYALGCNKNDDCNKNEDLPKDCSLRELLIDSLSHTNIRQQHELFYQTVGLVHGLLLNIDWIRRFATFHMNLDFGRSKIQRSCCHSFGPQLDGD